MKNINKILLALVIFGISSCKKQLNNDVKWNFKGFKKLTYEYYQVMENKSPFGMDEKMYNDAKGILIVSTKDNGKADIIFKNIKMSLFSISKDGDTIPKMSQTVQDFFMQDMDEFGKINGQLNPQTELLAQVLFPIPNENISVGEKSKLPTSMPFNMYGSRMIVSGFNELTLTSIENRIAKLSSVIDVSQFEIPEEANVNYDCYMKGDSKYTFNLEKGFFETATLNINMVAKTINNKDDKEEEENDLKIDPSKVFKALSKDFGIEMNTTIKLKLIETE